MSISIKAQKETWKFNTNTCNKPPSISFEMNFINKKSLSNTTNLKVKSNSPIALIVPNVPILPSVVGERRTISIPANSEISVSLSMTELLISFPTQPNWYELNENILSICQNFEKSQAISNMGLPRHIKQIALAHGG